MSVNILEYSDNTGKQKIKLALDKLSKVLCQPELENTHLAIVGIAGPLRSGKSFLLSYVLRYLRNNGWGDHKWIGDDNECAVDGMGWSGGIKAHTKGIHIWNEIFYVPTNNDEKLAVLFLDTQGLFDRTMDKEENTKLFTLTMLLCSNLMLNIKDVINERELQSLEFFTEYAKSVATELANQSPFQRLIFLMRDWQHSLDYAYGLSGGNDYLSDTLCPVNDSEQNTSVRENLRRTFEQLECFLMPHPGNCVKDKDFKGRNGDLDPEFLKYVEELVPAIFHPGSLQAKSYGGILMTGRSLWKLLQTINADFVNGELPEIENVTTAFAKMSSNEAMEDALNIFKQSFEKKQNECKNLDQNLHGFYEEAIKVALEHFKTKARFGPEDVKRKYREQLISECQDLYKNYHQFDELRQIKARNYSSDKVHEIWSRYMDNMKKKIQGKHQSVTDLNEMHKMQLEIALRSYQEEASIEVAFHVEHLQQLKEELLEHSFQKLVQVNEERESLEITGSVNSDDVRLVYEGLLFLYEISEQYRKELEKFAAIYVDENNFEKEMNKMKLKYFEIFDTNWSREAADIATFRHKFLQTLEEEYEDALKMNRRNKKLFDSQLEESGMRVKVNYRKIMHGLVEKCYVDPKTLENEHVISSERLLKDLKSEFEELSDESKNKIIEDVQQDISKIYGDIKLKNNSQKDVKPLVDSKTKVFTFGAILAGLRTTHSKIKIFRVTMGITKEIFVVGKKCVTSGCTVLPSKAATIAALPSATTVAIGAAVVGSVSLVAYGVYRYYNREQQNMIAQ